MKTDLEKNLGIQPIDKVLTEHQLSAHDLVMASRVQLTHKNIANAIRGRRLTLKMKQKILEAFNTATNKTYVLTDLFNY